MLESIKLHSKNLFSEIVSLRRYLHQYPELSFQEYKTSNRIAQELQNIGIPHITGIGGTGVIGLIEGSLEGPTIALRAELDALPIQEENINDYTSKLPNVMHACGHDVHMANLIGTSKILWNLRDRVKGKVLLIFQPGEELLPGGAKSIIESNFFQSNKPDIALGLHVLPEMDAGVVGFRPGPYMASGDEVYITVKGKGGHAALPHTLVDPILIASHIIVGLQQLVSRNCPASIPTVLSFGKIIGNGANNIIPSEVNIEGTFRTMDETWRVKAHKLIEEIAAGIAKSMGGDCIVEIRKGYPSLINSPELTHKAIKIAQQYLGKEKVLELPIRMTTDDFGYYAQIVPSVYFRIGVGFPDGNIFSLHNGKFDVNEYVLEHSTGLLAWLTINLLDNYK
jgi:amidohydrolase